MNIGIIIFAYNRSRHLSKALEALKNNSNIEKIYVFQDGLKKEDHREEWEKTTEVIKQIDWCEVNYSLANVNKGLKKSILDGVNYVFRENDAVVVLEDDCIATSNFMAFMRQGLIKYKNSEKVYSVSGYAWPIEVEEKKGDAYFCGRISSLGWGTWKDRWEKIEINYGLINEMKKDARVSERLALWGNDMQDILIGNIIGNTDSWAIFWALSVIKQGGLCLNPYYSLIDNIGFDGSGVHSGNRERAKARAMDEQKESFILPDKLTIDEEIKQAFPSLFGGLYIDDNNSEKQRVIVYGMGNYYKKYENTLNNLYYISMYIDKSKKGYYAGRNIGKMGDVLYHQYDIIILMMANLNESIKLAKQLHELYNVSYKKIKLGQEIFEPEESHIKGFSETGKLLIDVNQYLLQVNSYDEYANAMEVFKYNIYSYQINNLKKDIVFDIGGSIGDSALFFLMKKSVEKVYVYEPFIDTYSAAKQNLKMYIKADRLELNQYGISNKTESRNILYNPGMSCGQSTIVSVREHAKKIYMDSNLISEKEEWEQSIKVKRATEVFAPLLQRYNGRNFIMKMDCEGEEYNIIKDLSDSGLLQEFDLIMLEWHYDGKDYLIETLLNSGFSYWCSDKSKEIGLIYAFRRMNK